MELEDDLPYPVVIDWNNYDAEIVELGLGYWQTQDIHLLFDILQVLTRSAGELRFDLTGKQIINYSWLLQNLIV